MIATSLTSILKIILLSTKSASTKTLEINSKVGNDRNIKIGRVEIKILKNLTKSKKFVKTKKSKFAKTKVNKNLAKSKKADFTMINFSKMDFFILNAKLAFFWLRQTFTKPPIFDHFDYEYYICIETNLLEYVISEIFNQLILNQGFINTKIFEKIFKSNFGK